MIDFFSKIFLHASNAFYLGVMFAGNRNNFIFMFFFHNAEGLIKMMRGFEAYLIL